MKILYLHLPFKSYCVVTETEDTFDKEVGDIERMLESETSVWIPIRSSSKLLQFRHIFLTKEMKKHAFLESVVD